MNLLVSELFTIMRESTSAPTWSRGVILKREKRVFLQKKSKNEYIFKIEVPQKTVYPSVKIWLEDEDWNCDCPSKEDPCEHSIAAIIALKQHIINNEEIPTFQESGALIVYKLLTKDNSIHFLRREKTDSGETDLTKSITAIISGRIQGPKLAPSKEDLAIEIKLNQEFSGAFAPLKWLELAPYLSELENLTLDDEEIIFSKEKIGFIAKIEQEGGGVVVSIVQNPNIDHIYENGLVKCKNEIKILSRCGLDIKTIQEYSNGKFFGPKEFPEVVSEIIPNLKKHIPVDNKARNLPVQQTLQPRLIIETKKIKKNLVTSAYIIYGEPEVARVIDDILQVKNTSAVPVRNMMLENKLQKKLQLELNISPNKSYDFYEKDGINFAKKLSRWKGDIQGDGFKNFQVHPSFDIEMNFKNNNLNLSFNSFEKNGITSKATIENIYSAWKNNEDYVPLESGGWAPLPSDWLSKFGEKIFEILNARNENNALPPSILPQVTKIFEESNLDIPLDLKPYQNIFEKFSTLDSITLPEGINANLRDYQKEGVRWLSLMKKMKMGALLADDMGLGKTLQSICVMSGKVLVIAPTSVLGNWKREINKFRPNLNCDIYHGTKRTINKKSNIIITTYSILRIEIDYFSNEKWNVIILDEAQNIKNPESLVSKAAFSLNGDFHICLSGTPIENKLEELWSQFNFINRGLLGSKKIFREKYSLLKLNQNPELLNDLKKKIRQFIMRRKNVDVAKELPPKTEMILECEFSAPEKLLYESILLTKRKEVLSLLKTGGGVLKALEALLRLRQACCATKLIPGQELDHSTKVETLLQDLEGLKDTNSKALIFSQWTSLLNIIETSLNSKKYRFLRIDGSTTNRQDIVDQFQSEGGPEILLISLKAGGTGLNLTAADRVYIMDPWWNPAVEEQAADRAYRIGQTKPVIVKKLVTINTVEEKIIALQKKKKELADATLQDGIGSISLVKDDLLALLED